MYIKQASEHLQLEEGIQVIERLLVECYLNPGISTKELARRILLPTPIAAAIKRELMKAGALAQGHGVHCTPEGAEWIERKWGYGGLNRSLYQALILDEEWAKERSEIRVELERLFSQRPAANVQIDQSKCTPETSLRRAILCLREHALIGKRILCVGDDDLVSVSIGLLLARLFPAGGHTATQVDVLDIDTRFLDYIEAIAREREFPIQCMPWDLRDPLPANLRGQYDCFFTDPPYTLQGMELFVSRGIQALKQIKGLPIFLSFAHKSPAFMLNMQREFVRMGLTISSNYPRFNAYEAAEMIANRSQMLVLRTTEETMPSYPEAFNEALYTGEVRQTLRIYRCMNCSAAVSVGIKGEIATIEQLKSAGCASCGTNSFERVAKPMRSEG